MLSGSRSLPEPMWTWIYVAMAYLGQTELIPAAKQQSSRVNKLSDSVFKINPFQSGHKVNPVGVVANEIILHAMIFIDTGTGELPGVKHVGSNLLDQRLSGSWDNGFGVINCPLYEKENSGNNFLEIYSLALQEAYHLSVWCNVNCPCLLGLIAPFICSWIVVQQIDWIT